MGIVGALFEWTIWIARRPFDIEPSRRAQALQLHRSLQIQLLQVLCNGLKLRAGSLQSFQEPVVEEESLNHTRVLNVVLSICLDQGLLQAQGS